MEILRAITDKIQGKVPSGTKRSSKWPATRAAHLAKFPNCAVCGSSKKAEVHHKRPFHIHPELELEPTNFITLCESKKIGGLNCHLIVGHLGNFQSFNVDVEADSASLNQKIMNRPKDSKA